MHKSTPKKRDLSKVSLFCVDNQCLMIKQKDTDLRPYICPKSGTDVKKKKYSSLHLKQIRDKYG